MNSISGSLSAEKKKICIVAARFNDLIVEKLVSGAKDCLLRHGMNENELDIVWVPGAFEIPLMSQALAESKKYDGIVALGCVIRGSTTHYDYVCSEVAKGISTVMLKTGVPVAFGVLTTENLEQAFERSGSKAGNKGYEAAQCTIEMCNLLSKVTK
ncbi:MAG: 6,7-dimethyl-8-ribityllumazine synthase [Bacteriovoracaceae bacterium]